VNPGVDKASDFGVRFVGPPINTGVYLLLISVDLDRQVSFGKFHQGLPVEVPAGYYIYVGSALSSRGSSSLGYRLFRHTLRTSGKPPHNIQPILAEQLSSRGLSAPKNTTKKLRWHIDYLLDFTPISIISVFAVCTAKAYEENLATMLLSSGYVFPLAVGLGASDFSGRTHILRVRHSLDWWNELPGLLQRTGLSI